MADSSDAQLRRQLDGARDAAALLEAVAAKEDAIRRRDERGRQRAVEAEVAVDRQQLGKLPVAVAVLADISITLVSGRDEPPTGGPTR